MKKQVGAEHYEFQRYMGLPRWTSVWHQLNEVAALKPNKVMEVGPGAGYFKAAASCLGIPVETVDLDPELRPDHVASVTDLPFLDCSFDLTCAFQVLEHLPFEVALTALSELTRVARQHVVISLPDASRTWRYLWHLPKLGERRVLLRRPQVRPLDHHFDGEHYWELNKRGYDLDTVIDSFLKSGSLRLDRTFRPFENAYHRFFVFSVRPTTEQIARS